MKPSGRGVEAVPCACSGRSGQAQAVGGSGGQGAVLISCVMVPWERQ